MLTADTITDEQIVEMFDAEPYGSDAYHVCLAALSSLDAVSAPARAKCAEILNARAKEAK